MFEHVTKSTTDTRLTLILEWGGKDLFVDLGAEKLISAEKGNQKIAVEIKIFLGTSQVNDLEKAVGQYIVYRNILEEIEKEIILYLAVTKKAFKEVFSEAFGNLILTKNQILLIIVEPQKQEIIQWIS
jgi:hypothetical protein